MTLSKLNGKWSLVKLGLVFGILASIATCVLAMPIAIDYCRTAIAPWTSLPANLAALTVDVRQIKKKLNIP